MIDYKQGLEVAKRIQALRYLGMFGVFFLPSLGRGVSPLFLRSINVCVFLCACVMLTGAPVPIHRMLSQEESRRQRSLLRSRPRGHVRQGLIIRWRGKELFHHVRKMKTDLKQGGPHPQSTFIQSWCGERGGALSIESKSMSMKRACVGEWRDRMGQKLSLCIFVPAPSSTVFTLLSGTTPLVTRYTSFGLAEVFIWVACASEKSLFCVFIG